MVFRMNSTSERPQYLSFQVDIYIENLSIIIHIRWMLLTGWFLKQHQNLKSLRLCNVRQAHQAPSQAGASMHLLAISLSSCSYPQDTKEHVRSKERQVKVSEFVFQQYPVSTSIRVYSHFHGFSSLGPSPLENWGCTSTLSWVCSTWPALCQYICLAKQAEDLLKISTQVKKPGQHPERAAFLCLFVCWPRS